MLGDLGRRRGLNVGDLVAALREDALALQARAAGPALRRRVEEPVIRVIHQLHRGTGLARLLPGSALALLLSRNDRSRGGFFLYGLSDDGGFDDLPESFAACRSSRSTRALSSLISRYASASSAASSPCGRAASSPAVGRAGTADTAPPCHPGRPRAAHDRNRDQPATTP